MGYDMRFVRTPDGEAEAVAELREAFNEAANARNAIPREEMGRLNRAKAEQLGDWDAHDAHDGRTERYKAAQDAVMAASDAMSKAEKSYFRLNIFGMGRYLDLMARLGMAFEDEKHPPFPDPEEYDTDYDDTYAVEDPDDYPAEYAKLTPEQIEKATAFLAAQHRVLSWHGKADTPGIPFHKFGSNDGWIVLPAECEAAVRIWRAFVAVEGEEVAMKEVRDAVKDAAYWLRWIEYLAGAARHGGFRVW